MNIGFDVVQDGLYQPDRRRYEACDFFRACGFGHRERPAVEAEQTIPLPGVEGRIDHLSVDLTNQRLFIAALGNNTVEVLDIKGAKRLHTISGLHEHRACSTCQVRNRLFVASAKDGTCRIYDASSFQLLQTIEYGDDADNIRLMHLPSRFM